MHYSHSSGKHDHWSHAQSTAGNQRMSRNYQAPEDNILPVEMKNALIKKKKNNVRTPRGMHMCFIYTLAGTSYYNEGYKGEWKKKLHKGIKVKYFLRCSQISSVVC